MMVTLGRLSHNALLVVSLGTKLGYVHTCPGFSWQCLCPWHSRLRYSIAVVLLDEEEWGPQQRAPLGGHISVYEENKGTGNCSSLVWCGWMCKVWGCEGAGYKQSVCRHVMLNAVSK